MILLGVSAFALMLLGDLNDARFGKRLLRLSFPLGIILLAAATLSACDFGSVNAVWCAAAAIFLLLLLRSLFGSFPVKEAYVEQQSGRRVCDRGLYAMCRHPGVIFFAGLYACLHFGVRLPVSHMLLYIVLNLLLAAFEDSVVFPEVLEGYAEYKTRVPFLIPTINSLKNAFRR